MKARRQPLASVSALVRGVTFSKSDAKDEVQRDFLPVLRAGNIAADQLDLANDLVFLEPSLVSKNQVLRPNDIVMCMSSGSAAVLGKCGILEGTWRGTFGAFLATVRPNEAKCSPRYLYHFFRTDEFKRWASSSSGIGIKNIRASDLQAYEIPLPPLEEQKRIAAILDQADALRRLRARSLDRRNALGQAIFHEMFGDPRANPMGWPTIEIGHAVARISDGPFGSNLKSSHYVQNGVRVIRLQNIGVGEFVDRDKAFISEEHFKVLKKHECLPGDVLVGTLGDPNLRACIQPDWINKALNKADCVQLRPDQNTANAHYLAQLLNEPSVLEMASDKILGQTRARISMGRLRSVCIPIPPIALQNEFADRMRKVKDQANLLVERAKAAEALFTSLQHRAFRGEL